MKFSSLFLATFLACAPVLAHAEGDCASEFGEAAKASMVKPLARLAAPDLGPNFIGRLRDSIRRRLQVIHEHAYPIIALDDATPVKAYSLAADNFGTLTAEQKALVNIDDIKKEVNTLLTSAEAFPKTKQDFLDDTATQMARADALDEIVAKGAPKTGYYTDLELPQAKVAADGSVAITMGKERFTDSAQIEIARNRARQTIRERLGKKFFGLNGLDSMVMDQATRIKKLETYLNEIDRQTRLAADQGKPLSDDLKNFSDRIKAFYLSDNETKLKPEYTLPGWAWEKMHWMQLGSEARAVLQKDLPNLRTKVDNNEAIKFLKTLPPDELRAIGVGNLAQSASILGKTKWTQLLVTLGGTGTAGVGGIAYIGKPLYSFFVADAKAKELCATQVNDTGFQNCAVDYLQTKFPAKTIQELLSGEVSFLAADGSISDPKVAAEVKDMVLRRKNYNADVNFRTNSKEALSKAIQKVMQTTDISSSAYRQRIVETTASKDFNMLLIGNTAPKVISYLEFRFPAEYPRFKGQVQTILEADYNSPEQRADIQRLRDAGAESLANELNALIQDHHVFVTGGGYHSTSPIIPTVPPVYPTTPGTPSIGPVVPVAPGTITPVIPGSVSPASPTGTPSTAPPGGYPPIPPPTVMPPSTSPLVPTIPSGVTVPITIPGF